MSAGDETAVDDAGTIAPVPAEEVRRYFEERGPDEGPELYDPLEVRRRNRLDGMAVRGELEPVGAVVEERIAGVPTRRYRPADLRHPDLGIVWIHGGAWLHGDLDVYDGLARGLANAAGAEVIAVDYRLAPEHPFPAALHDVWRVVWRVVNEFDRVVLAGDSSGGNLAAAAAIKARDFSVPIAAQLLLYPVLDAEETPFKQGFRDRYTPFVNQRRFGRSTYDRIVWIWDVYAPDPAQRRSPLAAPMRAGDLRGLAPAVIVTPEHDILRGEAEDYAARLREDGVAVELLEIPGQIHGYLQMRGVFPDARHDLDLAVDALHRLLQPGQPDTPSHP